MNSSFKDVVKPVGKFVGKVVIPTFTTVVIWTYLDNVIKVLGVLLLIIIVLKNLGFDLNIAKKMQHSKFWRTVSFIARSTNTVAKLNNEYFEETGQIIADHIKKGGTTMSKIRNKEKEAVLWLKHNKRQILGYLSLILLALDYIFGITQRFGLPLDVINTLAGFLFVLALWVAGGEGFTSNVINRIRENAKMAKSEKRKKAALYKKELKKIDDELKRLQKYAVDKELPPDKKREFDALVASKQFYTDKVIELLEKASKEDKEVLE